MPKSYRIRTEIGKDKAIHVNLEQDFEYLEILSLKILQSDIYTRVCSDYGVVVGRITANNGTGLPNCKVSIFIPLSQEDEENAIISELYPYKTLNDTNDEGYRYNLLPYTKSHGGHTPTGTFPTRNDVLINQTLIEVYDKYYKFTVKTNDSGDFMIFGVPLGTQTIHVDVDLSDIGEFSMTPQDLVRIGLATPNQVSGTKFRSSSNLGELPQLLQFNRIIEVFPLWGQPEVCTLGITRTDFDLTEEAGITIQPAAVFMGSMFSNQDKRAIKRRCRVNRKLGNLCQLTTGPGEILAIRQTIGLDSSGLPVLEEYTLDEGGKVIDDNGTWLIDLPMNLEFIYTNEFGERTISTDPKIGVPTKAKYRFKIKWEQPATLSDKIKRASFLVPNVKEWGWSSSGLDPYINASSSEKPSPFCQKPDMGLLSDTSFQLVAASYAFSLNWSDYGTVDMIQEAINCEDRFYEFNYNKVYTVAELISEYRSNSGNKKFMAVRDVLDDTCESTNNPFPVNDAQFQFDILYLLFSIVALIVKPILILLLFVTHLFAWVICKIKDLICGIKNFVCSVKLLKGRCDEWKSKCDDWQDKCEGTEINLPLLTYPDCELCECTSDPVPTQTTGSLSVPTNPADADQYPPTVFLSINPETTLNNPNLLPLLNYESPSNYICYPPTVTSTSTTPSITKRTFTMSLPYNEKINLFNTKAKYFDPQVPTNENIPLNPGGGVNRIKVWFNINEDGNDPNSAFHYDNVFAMIIPPIPSPSAISVGPPPYLLTPGDLIRFSADAPPTDRNMTYYTGVTNSGYNDFGNRAITGVTGGTTFVSPGVGWGTFVEHPDGAIDEDGQIISGYTFDRTITYANYAANSSPAQSPQLSTNYKIFISERDTKNQRFGFDDEYFQVIYTGTVLNFLSASQTSGSAPNSFARRFLNGAMRFIENEYDDNFYPPTYDNPDSCTMNALPPNTPEDLKVINQTSTDLVYGNVIPNFNNYRVIFMVRGVDPHSTKVKCRYDLAALFGYNLPAGSGISSYAYEFMAHMNIPIQPTLRATRHALTDSSQVDTYSNNNLFFDTFGFTPDPNQYTDFNSQKPYNYSSLDATNNGGASPDAFQNFTSSDFIGSDSVVLTVDGNNDYTRELWASTVVTAPIPAPSSTLIPSYDTTLPSSPPSSPIISSETNIYNNPNVIGNRNRGYYKGEVVEGGSLLYIPKSTNPFTWSFNLGTALNAASILALNLTAAGNVPAGIINGMPQHYYYGQKYSYSPGMLITRGTSGRQLVMRSDRLPTSDKPTNTNPNSSLNGGSAPSTTTFPNLVGTTNSVIGFSNPLFNVTILDPAGEGSSVIVPGPSINAGDNQENQADIGSVSQLSAIAGSFTCDGIKPLDCYKVLDDGSVVVLGNGDECNTNNCCNDDSKTKCEDCNGEQIVEFGCYKLVTDPWKSRKLDKYLINEWLLRMRISFAACRNVWGHMFTNQWVNGTLFFYPLQVRTLYTSPGTDIPTPGSNDLGPNQPFACFCNHLVYFDFKTNNFYYRSTPYNDTSGFIGRNGLGFKGNVRLLGNPTTIMDLGPVNDYMDELSYSEDFLGYVVDRLDSTSFQDVDELLNLFIIQRLVSASIRNVIKSSAQLGLNKDPVRRYFSRDNNKVDGDYAQMIAINSQIGVIQFDTSTYQDPVDIYFGSAGVDSSVFGIFFSADTQIRDWLSPKRTIVTPGGDPLDASNCAFDNFPIFSQEIPMYLWQIKPNNPDVIFGAQKNEWFTDPITSTFNYMPYQSIDRLDDNSPIGSRTMIPHQIDNESYYLGYIHNTVANVTSAAQGQMDVNAEGPKGPSDRRVNNTAPFYFYFGLVKGSSAFDRFLIKWVKKDTNTF